MIVNNISVNTTRTQNCKSSNIVFSSKLTYVERVEKDMVKTFKAIDEVSDEVYDFLDYHGFSRTGQAIGVMTAAVAAPVVTVKSFIKELF